MSALALSAQGEREHAPFIDEELELDEQDERHHAGGGSSMASPSRSAAIDVKK